MSRSSRANCRSAATSSPSSTRSRACLGRTHPTQPSCIRPTGARVRCAAPAISSTTGLSFPSDTSTAGRGRLPPRRRAHAQPGRDRDRASGRSAGDWTVPVVHTLHDYQLLCPRKSLMQPNGEPCRPHPLLCGLRTRRMVRWAPAVSNVVGVSEFILGVHREMFDHAGQHLIMHPVVPPALRPLRRPGDRLRTLGYIGQMHVIKGIRQLIAGGAAGPGRARGVRRDQAGTGPLRQRGGRAAGRIPGFEYVGYRRRDGQGGFPRVVRRRHRALRLERAGRPVLHGDRVALRGRPVLTSDRGGLGEALDLAAAARSSSSRRGAASSRPVDRLLDPWRGLVAVAAVSAVSGEGNSSVGRSHTSRSTSARANGIRRRRRSYPGRAAFCRHVRSKRRRRAPAERHRPLSRWPTSDYSAASSRRSRSA